MSIPVRRFLSALVAFLWLAGVGVGLATLWSYESTPGPDAAAPGGWPAATTLDRNPFAPTIVVALHPQCPCSHATVAELSKLMVKARGRASVHALFVARPGMDADLVQSPLWSEARAIPGVRLHQDDGSEAAAFGARVSGQVLVYDGDGRLAFKGGITGSRGHQGDNAGRDAVEALLDQRPHAASTFAFGCLL